MSVNSKMTALADEIRELSGTTGTMGLDAMATHIEDANAEVDNQVELLAQAVAALEGKASGGEQAAPVISVSSNGLITATAGVKSSTHQLAFQAAKTITPSVSSQIAVSSGYYTGGNITVAAVPTQTKTVTPTSSAQNVTPDSGKFLYQVTVNGDSDLVAENIKSGVNIFGVTGTYVGSGGSGGDTSAEDAIISGNISNYTNNRVTSIRDFAFYEQYSLTTVSFQAATTIGRCAFNYCESLTTANFPAAITIASDAFGHCTSLTTVSFPAAKTMNVGAFSSCTNLTSVNFPVVTVISNAAFSNCYRLTAVSFPAAKTIGMFAFRNCSSLTTVSFPAATTICGSAFYKCYNLTKLYLMNSSVCILSVSNAFTSTPIGGYSTSAGTYGSIYVPASLLTAYQTATNWTYFSSRFVGI